MRDIDLGIFPSERKEKLESIWRYDRFEKLFYRPNLWMHTHSVLWLLEELLPVATKYLIIDVEKARALAIVHDDVEMLTGDVAAMRKARMTEEETQDLIVKEEKAIDELCKTYPEKINGYSYRELLLHAVYKDCVEAQLVSYVDKIEGYCESLHEIFAGNMSLIGSVIYYANTLPMFPYKYPELKDLLKSKESPLTYLEDRVSPYDIPIENYSSFGKPHTSETIMFQTDFPFYNTWKKVVISHGKIDWLINQREFLN